MSASVRRLPIAASSPVIQTRQDERLLRMAELIAARSQRKGNDCSIEDALSAVRASVAMERAGDSHECDDSETS